MIVVFGLAFELPLLLILLNFTGVLSGRRMLGWWRAMIMGITVFGAVATPSTDPIGMFALAGPVTVLYFGATAVALLNDRRRARRRAADPDFGLSDDEASSLDLTPEAIEETERVGAGELPAGDDPARRNGYDDVT